MADYLKYLQGISQFGQAPSASTSKFDFMNYGAPSATPTFFGTGNNNIPSVTGDSPFKLGGFRSPTNLLQDSNPYSLASYGMGDEGITKTNLGVGPTGILPLGTNPIGSTLGVSAYTPKLSEDVGGPSLFSKEGILGWKDADGAQHNGWGGLALGAGQGLMNAYLGMQMYGIAKDTLAANKDQFAKNYQAQVATTNARQQDLIQGRMGMTQAEKDALYNSRKIG